MAMLFSPVKALNELYIRAIPSGQIIKCAKAVRSDRVVLIVDDAGCIYSNSLGDYAYMLGKWPFNDGLMKCLVKLGIITKEQMAEHLAGCERASARSSAKSTLEYLPKRMAEFGLELTPEQIAKMQAIADTGGAPCPPPSPAGASAPSTSRPAASR